jgi:hypothetical protein
MCIDVADNDFPQLLVSENTMTLCPVAITVGCKKCPVFSICFVKGLVGDQAPDKKPTPEKDESEKS